MVSSVDDVKFLMLGEVFPDLKVKTSEGDFSIYEYQGDNWLIFFSHPRDFTPVCTTELGRVSKLQDEFKQRKTKVLALSCDSVESHKKWIEDINKSQKTQVNYPIVADEDFAISKQIGMYHPKCESKITVRTTYIISPDHKVRLMIQYPPSCGRSFSELLRVLDSLQLTDNVKVATPENWVKGDKCVILPTISNEEAKDKFPQGWEELTPYLRLVDVNKK